MIETVPLEHAADAYARMMQGKARFRMVLVTKRKTLGSEIGRVFINASIVASNFRQIAFIAPPNLRAFVRRGRKYER